ncbi:WD40/YVTN/BNR-like repeat-containing protein [Phaeocystidibacter luteus]|uniref:Glycosyl hydrolase n=1 Tax=Phaeocystidibacter luteus TaxID=911197 RepID=A0A6N6RMK0_9FLAO|nr:glycosyl hydrolase [Phaeocystidibacter luteus]KAB2814793.1 glycosyl hydrolase [Phaeocystidibacter luteus]
MRKLLTGVLALCAPFLLSAQSTEDLQIDRLGQMEWRNIGPFRGGRSCAVTGVPNEPQHFYFGSTGGGVWETTDGGGSWENISDDFFGGSVGAIAVSSSDHNIIYVGMGEETVRGNVSSGDGIWKSTDAGQTWTFAGLPATKHIGRIRIHPTDPNTVFVAAMGDLYKDTQERGVYKSTDGGTTWKKVLFSDAGSGAVDIAFDPFNPRHLYATTWTIRRNPWSLSSGGAGSALWKSTDGGESWESISDNNGFAKQMLGIIGIAPSPAQRGRLYAMVEARDGGLFRSDDGGENWTKVNDDRNLRQRAWYYTRIYADPHLADRVYVMNVGFHVSNDGGNSFARKGTPHGDHHDLWIAPDDNNRLIVGDDGGAQVSYDAAENWSTYMNQPTAQFYRVTTDDHFPFRIYGAQQDNSTVRIAHRSTGWVISEDDWESTAGGESAHIAVKPDDNDVVVGGSYGGFLTRMNHRTEAMQTIHVWPLNPLGHGVEDMKYRFQWNFPVFYSPHDPNVLYAASQHLHRSTDGGRSWEVISPDLSTNDSAKQVSSGGPITKDNTGVEYYCTIFAAVESPAVKGLLWAGSDDGLIHVSRDNGENWENVTPSGMPEWMRINSIEVDPFNEGGLYVAGTRYQLGDYQPYLYYTSDYGQSWKRIDNGIDRGHFTRVVRADADREGLLYAGTENGLYLSVDNGKSWKAWQLNLPIVPITDLTLKDKHLIAATQGRSFWVLDDLSPLHQWSEDAQSNNFTVYTPNRSWLMEGGRAQPQRTVGQNPYPGVVIPYFLNKIDTGDAVYSVKIMDSDGVLVREYSSDAEKNENKWSPKEGAAQFQWDLTYEGAKRIPGMILWWSFLDGPTAIPDTYTFRFNMNGDSVDVQAVVEADPRWEANRDDLKAQFEFLLEIRDQMTLMHQTIEDIRTLRSQMDLVLQNIEDEELSASGESIKEELTSIEETFYQTKNRSAQDPLNYPIRLNNQWGHLGSLASMGLQRPTQPMYDVKAELRAQIDEQMEIYHRIIETDIPEFNRSLREAEVEYLHVD